MQREADVQRLSLRYDRLWEYGEYCETTDAEQIEEIVAAIRALKVGAQSDVCVDDYTDILTFSFADGTTLTLEFEGQSWVKDTDTRYSVEGLSRLRNLLDEVLEEQTSNAMRPVPTLVIESNRHIFYATLADNSSAEVFAEKLSGGPIEIDMHDYGSFEKVGALPWSLPTNDESITTTPGDVILYQGNQLTIYYDENTWSFTRLAKIDGLTKRELLDAFGDGNVTVKLWVEWSE